MSDLATASDAEILAAIQERSNSKIEAALPHIEKLIEILNPERSVLQHTAAEGAGRGVYQSCATFKKISEQLKALQEKQTGDAATPTPQPTPQA
ncbi:MULTISPECIES: hypothetical protein [Pseudomonadota]|uniref:hypothetical protein n=1 Tax=Pseudomonadota TaxID=1224 RepID=UPI0026197B7B|nr:MULTISPECIES: hypothetical protein [Pseudomonadota]